METGSKRGKTAHGGLSPTPEGSREDEPPVLPAPLRKKDSINRGFRPGFKVWEKQANRSALGPFDGLGSSLRSREQKAVWTVGTHVSYTGG